MYANLVKVGGVTYTEKEKEFGNQIIQSLGIENGDLNKAAIVQPYKNLDPSFGSTDVGASHSCCWNSKTNIAHIR